MAKILPLTSPDTLDAATRVIRGSGLLACPTESFYALAASASDPVAVARVAAIKGRRPSMPILSLIGDRTSLMDLAAHLTPAAQALIERFWPGPLTLIFSALPSLPRDLTASTGSVGVRHVDLPPLLPLLHAVGPITGTSANRTGQPPAQTAQDVDAYLGSAVDLILDGGPAPGGSPSTIVETREPVRLIRQGPISREQVAAALAPTGIRLMR